MNDNSQLVSAMRAEEKRLLTLREETARNKTSFNEMVSLGLIALDVVFLAVVVAMFNRVEKLQRLVTICSWTKRVEFEGKWVSLEEYLAKRFNISVSHGVSAEAAEEFKKELALLNDERKNRIDPGNESGPG